MDIKLSGVLAALLVACSLPEVGPGSASGVMGEAEQPYCAGLVAVRAAAGTSTVCYVWPDALIAATDGWGPQALSLSVDRGFAPQIAYERAPSLSLQRDDITRSIQTAVGFSVTENVNLVATTTVLVPTEAYYRVEAYPEYQVTGWELRADACGFQPETLLATGFAYRPTGVHFRVLVQVGGAWNALRPPTPAELSLAPPWSPGGHGTPDGGVPQGDGGTPGG